MSEGGDKSYAESRPLAFIHSHNKETVINNLIPGLKINLKIKIVISYLA